ncbi:MAG TPA: BatA domain-containing protein [Bryobacteraceae bacterium]|nr:BatA domain-containing protein [Bryobacteraceae bacterium]
MGFLAPWFLAGALAVGLPIWLHLLQQHKTTPLPFSSLMFFEKRTQSSIKHRRLKYLLLFALRVALLILLALAFANPFINTSGAAASAGKKLIVLAVDNSYSMRQGGRLDRAKQQAIETLPSVRGEDKGVVLAFNSGAHLMNEATTDAAALRGAIQAIQPTDARGSYAELARSLRSLVQSAKTPVEAHVFSDMQKSSWPANFVDARLAEGTRLVFHPVADRRLPNFAVETVNAPRHIYDPKKVRIQATVAGYGTPKAARRVALFLNGKEIASKDVETPAGGRASVEFLTLDAPYGMNRGEIRISPADDFPSDDHLNFSIERADPRRILFVHEQRNPRGVLYYQTALDASNDAAFNLETVTVEQVANISPARYALVVLSDVASLPGAFEAALDKYVRGGGAVMVALGRMSTMHGRVPVFGEAISETRYATREGERFQSASYVDPTHPAVGRAHQWDNVKFYQTIRVEPGKSKIVARLSDDTPLLLEKQIGEGRVLVFASTFDNVSNDFPLHPAFVPFVAETANYLSGLEDASPNYTVGSFLELRSTRAQGSAVEVLDPAGRRALTLEEAARAQTLALGQEGFYDVRRPSGRHELVAVNADRRESDLDVLPAETLTLWQNTGQGAFTAGGPGETGSGRKQSFWWYVLLAALALAVAETIVGNQHLSVDKEAA